MDKLSPNEKEIVSILGRKKMTITDIAKELYGRKKPIHANTTVANAIGRINAKSRRYKLPFKIKGNGLGRSGKIVWRESK